MNKAARFSLAMMVLLVLVGLAVLEPVGSAGDPAIVRIGVLANRGAEICLAHWVPTAQYLTAKIPGKTFRIVPVDFEQIYSVVQNREVDFILANPAFYVELEAWYRVNRIATLKNRHTRGSYTGFAGVIVTRADHGELHTLNDLKGSRFAAVKETSLGGWLMAKRELLEHGIDPHTAFASLTFAGTHDAVVYAVLEGRADAGTVRSDTLERMAAEGRIRLDQFRVLPHPEPGGEEIPFLHSTRVYPEWPIAKVRHTDDELAQQVAVALFQMPAAAPAAQAAECAGWAIPLNYQSVHDCLRALKVGPYKDLGRITPLEAVRAFWKWVLAVLLGFVMMAGATLAIHRLNRRLALSNQRFRAVMEGLDALVYVADMETYELLYINRYGRKTWGEVTGKICWQVLQSDQTGPCVFCTNDRLLDSQRRPAGIHVWEFQNTINRHWYECRDQAIHWTDGRLVRLEIATDITGRKQAQDQLLQQNRFLNHVLESLTHPFMVINADDFSVEMANSATGEHCPSCKCHELTHRSAQPCNVHHHPCPVELIKRSRKPAMVEHIHYDRKGEPRSVEVHGYPIFDAAGRVSQVIEYSLDITDRKRAERALQEKEEYLRTMMATIQTGVLISELDSGHISDINPFAARLIGEEVHAIIGRPWTDYLEEAPDNHDPCQRGVEGEDGRLKTAQGGTLSVRLASAQVCIREHCYTIHSFLDISDIRELIQQQVVNIELAKGLLSLVNPGFTRYHEIDSHLALHIEALSLPCRAAGGDHFFIRPLGSGGDGAGFATYLSVKDQSGHEVNCTLRSIFTDLVHHAVLQGFHGSHFEGSIEQLNDRLIKGGMFAGEDFLTAILAHIDHATLYMQFAACGHPPLLLIRDGRVVSLPQAGGLGQNLPLGVIENIQFTASRLRLRVGDKLLFYTDGLTEMPLEKRGWKLSRQRLEELVSELLKHKEDYRVNNLMVDLLAAVADLSGQQVHDPATNTSPDDVTLLGLEVEDCISGSTRTLTPRATDELCEDIRELSTGIADQWQRAGLTDAPRRVRMVLEEAVLNAWEHGLGFNQDRPITIRWREGNDFHLEVIDTGSGFDPDRIVDPTLPNNRLNISGRGIYMIRLFADEVQWRDGGRHLMASFYRHPHRSETFRPKSNHQPVPLWPVSNG